MTSLLMWYISLQSWRVQVFGPWLWNVRFEVVCLMTLWPLRRTEWFHCLLLSMNFVTPMLLCLAQAVATPVCIVFYSGDKWINKTNYGWRQSSKGFFFKFNSTYFVVCKHVKIIWIISLFMWQTGPSAEV